MTGEIYLLHEMLHFLHFDSFDLFSSLQGQWHVLAQCSVLDQKYTLAYSDKCATKTLAAFLTVIAKWLAVVDGIYTILYFRPYRFLCFQELHCVAPEGSNL